MKKFRAWIISEKKYIYICGFCYWNTEIRLWWQESSDHIYNRSFLIKDIILEQYTGLKDSNGKEIYEGDIVEFTWWWFDGTERESVLTGTIAYDAHYMSFKLKGFKNKEWQNFVGHENDTEYFPPFSELNYSEADLKIIGNIHENPELLK
jgi:uncharacterized phage protein (TIGR01671 family)